MILGFPLAKIFGGTSIALAVALAFVMFRADAISNERDRLQDWQDEIVATTRLAADRPKLGTDSVALQIFYLGEGVAKLKAKIAELNQDAIARANEFEASLEAAERETALLERAARSSDRRIAELLDIAENGAPSCEAPPDLIDALEGL